MQLVALVLSYPMCTFPGFMVARVLVVWAACSVLLFCLLLYFSCFGSVSKISCCPACRTTLIATRFWVVMICPIIKCLTVLEFSFILFDLCLFITIFNFILNYVLIVTFWIFTYHKILIFVNYLLFYMKLLNYLFFNMFGSVLECCELTGVSLLRGFIDLLDTSVIVFVNNLLWFVFHFMLFA